MNSKDIETNLFDIYQRVADYSNIDIISLYPFKYIAYPLSPWPNMIFVPEEVILNFDQIQLLTDPIRKGNCPKVLIMNEHLATKSVVDDLRKNGFMPITQWTNMSLKKTEDIVDISVDQLDIKIINIDNGKEFSDWLNITASCLFNNESINPEILKNGLKNNFFKLLIGYYNGIPASTTLLFLGESAGIYMVATLPSFRRLGIGKALMKRTQSLAYSLNYNNVVLHTTKEGMPLYRSLGYSPYDKMILFFLINS